jgi:hypothetical protein
VSWPDPVVDAGDDHTEDFSEMTEALEAAAVNSRPDHDGMIRLSTAISLKRIADALHHIAMCANHAGGSTMAFTTREIDR